MIDPNIEQALAPSKEDWKEPLWVKFKNWVKGTSAAVVVVALLLLGVVLWLKPEPQPSEPITMTIETIPQATRALPAPKRQKYATENIATQTINTPVIPSFDAVKPITKESSADDPLAPALAEFDKQLINLESKL